MYSILSRGHDLNLSTEDHSHLSNKIVVPILFYGCEMWGFENNKIIEKVHLKFYYCIFYHGYCKDQWKAVFIILQQMHGYWKIDAHHYIQRE
jgi:hypothetical protein